MEHEQPKSMKFLRHMLKPLHYYKLGLKSWGFEYWFENNEQYCGKIIMVRENQWSSFGAFHYHRIKDETFLVLSGTLLLDVLNLASNQSSVQKSQIPAKNSITLSYANGQPRVNRYFLEPYDYLRLRPKVLHRFSALDGEALFTETSMTHREDDSYRIVDPPPEEQLEYNLNHIHGTVGDVTSTMAYNYRDTTPPSSTREGIKDAFLEDE